MACEARVPMLQRSLRRQVQHNQAWDIGTRPEQTRTFSLWVDLDCKNPVDLKESVTDVATDDVLLRS